MNYQNCFANKGVLCSALMIKSCQNCVFFKTTEQVEEERQRAKKRLENLGLIERCESKYECRY